VIENRTVLVAIEEAEIAYLSEIIEQYRSDQRVAPIHRHVSAVSAKRFVNRAIQALPINALPEAMTPS
jgi:hypothetical protein